MNTSLPLYILAGGNSSRFGTDKARHPVRGKALLVRVAEQFAPAAGPVTVVAARAGQYQDLGFTTIADRRPGLGPLAGLEAAARHAGAAEVFLLASCDRVGLHPSWVEDLRLALRANPGKLAAAFHRQRPPEGQIPWEPFPAVFRPAVARLAAELLDRGERVIARVLDEVGLAVDLPPGWERVVDANRPGDLEHHRAD